MPVDVLGPQPGEVNPRRLQRTRQQGAADRRAARRAMGRCCCIERDARKVATFAAAPGSRPTSPPSIVNGDAAQEILPREQRFDRVLVDAPCSGTGVVGRHPEARWKKQGGDGERLALTQRAILEQTGASRLSGRRARLCGLLDGSTRND